jgi:protein MpaA
VTARRSVTVAAIVLAAACVTIAVSDAGGKDKRMQAGDADRTPFLRLADQESPQPTRWPDVVGRSADGHKIRIVEYGVPAVDDEVLVFGCIHGDECAARRVTPLDSGCPPLGADVYVVPNLNPDGFALGTRLNSRGVDLNRNFPTGWKPIGEPGTPQHSGARPFSERETRLAARIIRTLDPEVTIWFHQHWASRPLVRGWGQSVPMARRFATLANLPFKRLPWLAGTAPNWQNHTFPGTASFVVELPRGPISSRQEVALGTAIVRFAREEVAN